MKKGKSLLHVCLDMHMNSRAFHPPILLTGENARHLSQSESMRLLSPSLQRIPSTLDHRQDFPFSRFIGIDSACFRFVWSITIFGVISYLPFLEFSYLLLPHRGIDALNANPTIGCLFQKQFGVRHLLIFPCVEVS